MPDGTGADKLHQSLADHDEDGCRAPAGAVLATAETEINGHDEIVDRGRANARNLHLFGIHQRPSCGRLVPRPHHARREPTRE